jgi:prepilin-type N-terminal cleavage/methylation domain-containing protein
MNTALSRPRRRKGGFTLVEILISMSIGALTIGLALSTFLMGLRMMYKDSVRLQTNSNLRYLLAQLSKETLDSSEFYIFPSYTSLNGTVNLTTSVSSMTTDAYGASIAHGDCVVLVTRTAVTANAAVRQFRIYYRLASVANRNNEAELRYYESADFGQTSTYTDLAALLNNVNLNSTPIPNGSRQIAARAKGRRMGTTSNFYPIFCSEAPTVTATNESFSINVEIINGTTADHLISSSSFNYTISPRR